MVSSILAIIPSFLMMSLSLLECLQAIGQEPAEKGTSEDNLYRQIFSQKVVHLLALFSLIYVGTEVTIGGDSFNLQKATIADTPVKGWTVTYIIDERNGGPSAGYISSGFFGGAKGKIFASIL